MLFMFITPRIVVITVFHADSGVEGETVAVTLLMGCFYVAVWVGYYKCYHYDFMKRVSFRKNVRSAR